MQAEKERLRQEGAALMLQGAWRCKRARRAVGARRAARREADGAVVVASLTRRWLARRKAEQMVAMTPRPLIVEVVRARGVRAADGAASDPCVPARDAARRDRARAGRG